MFNKVKQNGLLVLETLGEAKYFVNTLHVNDKRLRGCEILSLQPNIQAYLAENNIKSVSSADTTDIQSHKAIMDKCEELENYISDYVERQGAESPEEHFENAYLFYLRLIWRHFLWDIEVLDRCLEHGQYKKLFSFQYKRIVTLSPWIEDDQLYVGEIAEQICKNRNIEYIPLRLPAKPPERNGSKNLSGKIDLFFNRFSYYLLRFTASILSKKKTLLVPSFKYNMNRVCDDLKVRDSRLKVGIFYIGKTGVMEIAHAMALLFFAIAKRKINRRSVGYPVDFALPLMTFAKFHEQKYNDSTMRQYVDATVSAFERGEGRETVFKRVDLSQLLKQKVEDDLNPYMLNVAFQLFGLERTMKLLQPNYVISQMGFEIRGALGHVAKKLKIPSVLISHGSHVTHEDKYAAREHNILAHNLLIGDFGYFAVQSPLARDVARRLTDDPKKIVNIRPMLWGRNVNQKRSRTSGELTIVHAGTFKLRHNRRYIYETSDEFVKGLKELCEVFSGFPRLKLVIKIRPDIYELSLTTLKALLPTNDNISIETQKLFLEVLKEADLLISFSSTTIEEALNNSVPVLLYGGAGRYAHIPVEPFSDKNDAIRKAVTFVKDKISLQKYLTKLDDARSSFEVSEDEFKEYCFSENKVIDFTRWFLGLRSDSV